MRILAHSDLRSMGIRYHNVHLARLEAAGKFPRRVKLSEGIGGRIGWVEEEVVDWLAARAALRDGSAKPATPRAAA